MLRRVIRFALRQRLLTVGAGVLVAAVGVGTFRHLPIEAFPDVTDPRVQIIALWPGHAAEELETMVTQPVERQMNGTPSLVNLRSISMAGLSVVTLTFEDGTAEYFARQQVLERLNAVSLPNGVSTDLPPVNAIGEIYRYTIEGPRSLTALRELQDWVVEPALRTVPWVADVVAFGGAMKEYQVNVDVAKMLAYGVTLADVEHAIAAANANSGGGYISHGYEKQVIRGEGLFRNTTDIERVAVATRQGTPVRVSDLASVTIGSAPREGIAAKDSADDVVEGIVVMRKGGNATEVLKDVRAKIAYLNDVVLPRDVRLKPFYDRADLVNQTTRTVTENLALGAMLVLVVLVVFLGDWRSALVVGAVIPLSLLFAFILMDWLGVSANLVSLGAVDFGVIVDASVVMVEAFLVRLAAKAATDSLQRREVIATTAEVMGRPILFSKAILVTAFLPIFTFQRVEKRIFAPMALSLSFAFTAALILAVTLVPVLASFGVRGQHHETWATQRLRHLFSPTLDWALRHGRTMLAGASALLVAAALLGARLGTEFLPAMDEGNIWLRVTMPVGISLDAAKTVERDIRQIIRSYQPVSQVVTHLGRPDDGTDPKGTNTLEVYVSLRPRGEWVGVANKDTLVRRMNDSLRVIPGIELNFSQYIKDNVDEALSGVTGELVIKIFGPDLRTLQEKAGEIKAVLARIPGVADLGVEQQFGQPQLRFEIDRTAIARHGLSVADVNEAIETGIGGTVVTHLLEGERVFNVRVRYAPTARNAPSALAALPVTTADGRSVQLASVAHVVAEEGASRIAREANERRIAIKWSVRGRDQGGFVAEAQHAVSRDVRLPPGYRVTWAGQFENQRRATARLAVVVPTSILFIFILLFSTFGSVRYATLILVTLPCALIGGIATLWVRNINLSISAAIGFIVLFGIAVQNGVILVAEFNRLRAQGLAIADAVRQGTLERVRPVVMTALMGALGLLPAALSTNVGAETIRPFASVIVGGLATATLLTLLILPVLYRMFHEAPHAEIAP
jgi:cobalt-zinc-cadmium resistance protein CzcA